MKDDKQNMWFFMKIKSVAIQNLYHGVLFYTNYSKAEVTERKTSKIHAFTWTEKWKIHVVKLKVLFTITNVLTIYIFLLTLQIFQFIYFSV